MANIPGNTEWVGELIPDLEGRRSLFVVDTDEVDDELIEVFIEELQRLSGELSVGLEQNNSEMVRMAAHSIKGMGGTIGLPELSVLGLEIETRTKEGCLQDSTPLIVALEQWMTSLN